MVFSFGQQVASSALTTRNLFDPRAQIFSLNRQEVPSAQHLGHYPNRAMGPTTMPTTSGVELHNQMLAKSAERPRRGSMPELRSAEKKAPTGPRANPLYKTRLCMNFQATGSCPYTDKCQFAHGEKELEKWENWRSAQKASDLRRNSLTDSDPRSSQDPTESFMISPPFGASGYHGSPIDLMEGFDASPAISSVNSVLDDSFDRPEEGTPFQRPQRARAATYDATYDNMSQLRDAPTLFSHPPIFGRSVQRGLQF